MSPTVDDAAAGLVLEPFRGVRYVPRAVDLAAVTSPPYDLIGPGEADRLEAQEPHNLVRLTLPDRSAPDAKYARAGQLLGRWLDTGVLRRDEAPALYVYEERGDGHVQRGLIGALGLRAPEERVILPHEDVHPVPVRDRLTQMRATGANLEPIYLLARGTGAAADVVAATAGTTPLLTARASWNDHTVDYRLWAVTRHDDLATVASALHDRQALIADGHHRYAAYRALQAEHRDAGDGHGAWDYGLAFLVDSAAYPPTLQAIHRVVAQLKPAELLASLPPSAGVTDAGRSLGSALAECARAGTAEDTHAFLVTGDDEFRLVTLPVQAPPPSAAHSAAWYGLDISILHELVFGDLLHVPDDQVRFVHSADEAVRAARATDGTAVLLNPPTEADVHAVAAAGDRMPRKSTSFGPKPRNGLVLRLLAP